jgi:hypothetical protein
MQMMLLRFTYVDAWDRQERKINAPATHIDDFCTMLDIPKKRRRRVKQTASLGERLLQSAREARAAAKQLPPGVDQARLLKHAREAEAVAQLDELLKR